MNIGQETYQQTLNEYKGRILSKSDGRTQMVEKVCSRLIAAIDPKDLDPNQKTDWKVFVVKDDQQKNAFVVPGGKIFVFTGILRVCKDEDGLATVLGHGESSRTYEERENSAFASTTLADSFDFRLFLASIRNRSSTRKTRE